MESKRGPTLRAQWLGQQLREWREAQRLTLKDAGDYVQRDPATVSRMESGIVPARTPDVLAFLNLYQVDDERQRQALENLSRDVWQKGWWDGYAEHVAGALMDLSWLESRAQGIRSFDALVLPGLLQSEGYARATIQAADPDVSAEQFERWVEFRRTRQYVLDRCNPPSLFAIVDEGLLRRPIGGPAAMRTQLAYLLEATKRANVELRVLPYRAGAHASPDGCFRLLEMPEPYPEVAHMDTAGGSLYVESDRVTRLAAAYDRMRQATLDADESAALIAAAMEGMQ